MDVNMAIANVVQGNRTAESFHMQMGIIDIGKEIEQILNGSPASPNCETFQNFGGKHEASNDQRSEELSDSQRRDKSDGHREFHRHLSFDDVLDRFLEDRIPADQRSCDANYTDARKWLPKPEPYCRRSQCHKGNTNEFSPFQPVFVLFVLRAIAMLRRIRSVLPLIEQRD